MILVTGGTGFIGRSVVRSLAGAGHEVRLLLRPSPESPNLPRGVQIDAAVTSLQDDRGLRAALVGVDIVYHLAGAEREGAAANLLETDIRGTESLVRASADAGIDRFFYVSHLGADRASAYPVMKSKAIAEEHVRRSGLDYTILRTALVYGKGDRFTSNLARLLHALPFVFLVPGVGDTMLQPIWVEDLATCLAWALDDDVTRGQTLEVGGPEYLSFFYILEAIMERTGVQRSIVPTRPPYLRAITVILESLFPGLPVSVFWLDYLASNRTCALDTVPRTFGLLPSRFQQRLDYLDEMNWRRELWRSLWRFGRA